MCILNIFNKKPSQIRQISFENVAGVFDYPKNVRIPNIGEYVWFNVWKKGYVTDIENIFDDDSIYVIKIRVSEKPKKSI